MLARGVVEIRDRADRVALARDRRDEVEEVLGVALQLCGGRELEVPESRDPHKSFVHQACPAPPLQLDQDVGRLTGFGPTAAQQRVDALWAVREPVLEQHLDVAEPPTRRYFGTVPRGR